MKSTAANVVSIPPGSPYLPTLVDALLKGELIEGFVPGNDPLALSTATIWVPTRRAVRALASEFTARLEGDVALLPIIKALGDVDDDNLFFESPWESGAEPHLEPTISALERHLDLSLLVAAWAETLNPKQRELYQGEEIIMPSSLCDAVWFAGDLTRLMDMVATEEADWKALETLVPDQYNEWWKLTLEFLKIATTYWPKLLAERGLQDSAVQRAKMLRIQEQVYREKGSSGPVIAAGSTGSIPATADLLKTIAHMENGALVLPGLDRDLDNETWAKVDLPDNDRDDSGTAPGHPQYGLKKLLTHIGIARSNDDIRHIGGIDDTSSGFANEYISSGFARVRETLISEALRPSFSTGAWQDVFKKLNPEKRVKAFAGVALVEAKGEREEALAIALALRETLADEFKTVALVTPDRNLARRVAVEMRRFGVPVDDSAGQPLRNRPPGTLVRLVQQMAFGVPDPVALISLLKHPLALFGSSARRARHAARLFELAILRGAITPVLAGEFHAEACEKENRVRAKDKRLHRSIKRFSPTDWEDLKWLANSLDDIFCPEKSSSPTTPLPLNELAQKTIHYLELCGQDEDGKLNNLYGNEEGRTLYNFLGELLDVGNVLDAVPSEWPDIFDALLGHKAVRPLGGTHPRVSILGPLEARLQTFDRVVLGGLNEKTWPASARNDPFLSRPMKTALGLPPPERRTGLAAHDFQILLGMEDVVLTRSIKAGNAPTVMSRWVQRMNMVAGLEATNEMVARGAKFTDWAKLIDAHEGTPKACPQPKPAPPIDVRPTKLSITEIEKWIADPYAIYAKHILVLNALEPLLRDADARERGTLYHGILEEFVLLVPDPNVKDALEQLLDIAQNHFDTTDVPPEFAALWWPRFGTIAEAFLEWHRQQFEQVKTTYVEKYETTEEGLDGFTLSGMIDRIDVMKDGSFNLFDYKTGLNPRPAQVNTLDAPQLPLGAVLAYTSFLKDSEKSSPSGFAYVRLQPKDELQVDWIGKDGKKPADPSADQLMGKAWEALKILVEAYRDPQQGYWSKARIISDKDWASDYDHLARVREWSIGDDSEEGQL
ncbi:MAG: double-strand break repair protein AddB [Rhizobiaceae bacterium]